MSPNWKQTIRDNNEMLLYLLIWVIRALPLLKQFVNTFTANKDRIIYLQEKQFPLLLLTLNRWMSNERKLIFLLNQRMLYYIVANPRNQVIRSDYSS